jgi:4-hydroxybenzoate polyprenyltransferase
VAAPAPEVALALFLHFAALNVLMDVKDVAEDRAAGTVTVPTLVGEQSAIRALLAVDVACAAGFGTPALRCLFCMDALWTSRYLRAGPPPTNAVFPVWCSLLPLAAALAGGGAVGGV